MENVGLLQIACRVEFSGEYEFVGTTFSIMDEKASVLVGCWLSIEVLTLEPIRLDACAAAHNTETKQLYARDGWNPRTELCNINRTLDCETQVLSASKPALSVSPFPAFDPFYGSCNGPTHSLPQFSVFTRKKHSQYTSISPRFH